MSRKWITEQLLDDYHTSLSYKEMLYDHKSRFQHIRVIKNAFFGNVLLLDGVIQLTEMDNHGYHEMITHIPMLAHENPQNILIIGGGDGGALQQVLCYSNIKKITLCEIDKEVIDVCSKYFPGFGHPFNDPRVEIMIEDAFSYLGKGNKQFDVIIVDITDPIGEAKKLYTIEFYRMLKNALNKNGVISKQCENIFFNQSLILEMVENAKSFFKNVSYYYTLVPTYPGGSIGFLYMSEIPWVNGLSKQYPCTMKYLNPGIHKSAFEIPEFFRAQME